MRAAARARVPSGRRPRGPVARGRRGSICILWPGRTGAPGSTRTPDPDVTPMAPADPPPAARSGTPPASDGTTPPEPAFPPADRPAGGRTDANPEPLPAMTRPSHILLLAAFLLSAPAEVHAQSTGTLVVANRRGGSVSFFDLEAGLEVGRLPVGPRIPHEVAVSPDGRRVLVGEYGGGADHGRHLIVIDLPGVREVGRIDLGARSRPHSMAFLPDGRRAVATMEESDRLALVDLDALEVVRTYPTGGREGHMVRVSSDGARAYVTNRGAEGTLSVIFLDEERGPVVIPAGEGAEGVAVSTDDAEVWVANRIANTISVIDTRTLAVAATVEAPADARRVEISPTGRVLVPNAARGGSLAQYDLATRELVVNRRIREEGESGSAGILAVGARAFISDRSDDAILVYDLEAPGVRRILATDHDAPDGIGWSPLRVAAFDERPER